MVPLHWLWKQSPQKGCRVVEFPHLPNVALVLPERRPPVCLLLLLPALSPRVTPLPFLAFPHLRCLLSLS